MATVSELASASTSASVTWVTVVGGGGAELDRDLDARAVAELVGVHARRQALGDPGLEDRAGLLAVERAVLAEDVDPARVRRAGVEHLALDEVDVGVGRRTRAGRRARRGTSSRACAAWRPAGCAARRGRSARSPTSSRPSSCRSAAPRAISRSRLAPSCSSVAARVASTVVLMPPGACRAGPPSARRTPPRGRRRTPDARGSRRSPGITARPCASKRSPPAASGVCARGPAHATRPSSKTSAASRDRPQLGVVGDERADVVDQHGRCRRSRRS